MNTLIRNGAIFLSREVGKDLYPILFDDIVKSALARRLPGLYKRSKSSLCHETGPKPSNTYLKNPISYVRLT